MFEEMTYEKIMERMLSRVPDALDKREGAIIFDALAPAAFEMSILYTELETALDQTLQILVKEFIWTKDAWKENHKTASNTCDCSGNF